MAQVGLKNIYYAIMTSDTSETTTYSAPVKLGAAISVDLNIEYVEGELYGDDTKIDAFRKFKSGTITIETSEISLENEAKILGATYADGKLTAKSSDKAPYVALLFESEAHDGSTLCVKIYKVRFSTPQETYNTQGESIDYQTPKLEGVVLARLSDGDWRDKESFAAGASTADWYTSV